MDQRANSRFSNNTGLNSVGISSELLNRCFSGRRGDRLTSILPSQLLARGGTRKQKFAPNIPVRKEKSEEESSQEKTTGKATKDGRNKRQDRSSNSRGRGRGKTEVVQLQGSVFGEGGVTERFTKKERISRFNEHSGNTSNAMAIPVYTPVSVGKSDEEDEKESLKKLLKDDFLFDSDDDSDTFGPVKLPLTSPLNCKKEESKSACQTIKIKQEPVDDMYGVVVKKEPLNSMDERMDYDDMDFKDEKHIEKVKPEIKHETENKNELFSDTFTNTNIQEHGELLFFHFPDCLPRNCLMDDDDITGSTQKTETLEDDNDECQKNCRWSLKEMPEGFIGKLQVLKSGKVQLKIGTLCFDVKEGLPVGFLQQVAKLNMNQDSGDLHVLGDVKKKIVCFPNLENLTSYNCT